MKGNHCKHIVRLWNFSVSLFANVHSVICVCQRSVENYSVTRRRLKRTATVLQVPFESHVWYQKALLSTELEEIFASAPMAPNDVSHPRVLEAYARVTGKTPAGAAGDDGKRRRKIDKGTECPICYEDMFGVQDSLLAFCDTCGNALHNECFGQCNVFSPPLEPVCSSLTRRFGAMRLGFDVVQGPSRRAEMSRVRSAAPSGPWHRRLLLAHAGRTGI